VLNYVTIELHARSSLNIADEEPRRRSPLCVLVSPLWSLVHSLPRFVILTLHTFALQGPARPTLAAHGP